MDKEKILNEYYCNDGAKIKKVVSKIIRKFGGIYQKDYDDFYSIANREFMNILNKYDGKRDFEGLLYSCLLNKIKSEITRKNRIKRTGDRQAVSIETILGDDNFIIEDTLKSDFDLESEVSDKIGLLLGDNFQKYLDTLGQTQKQIAKLIMIGYKPVEIQTKLNLSVKQYYKYIDDMKMYEKSKILKEEVENKNIVEHIKEAIPLEKVTITTSEKTKNTSYSLEAIEKKLRKRQLRDDHVLQRTSGQHNLITKSELMSDILQGRALTQIIISEEIKDGVVMHWLIDGKQRCTNVVSFMNDGFAISKNVQIYDIPYQTEKLDENGNIVYNEEGFPIPIVKTFDIRNKKFSQLPDELQDKFKEYQIPVLLNLNCTKKDIAYDIARFNRCRPMNIAQNGWTGLDETYAEYIDNILKMDFFKIDCKKTKFTNANIKSGALRRTIVDAIITSRYIESYSDDFRKMCKFLSNEAKESDFIDFYDIVDRLNTVLTSETATLFNIKNTYLWIALFDKFTTLGLEDSKFNDFIIEFAKSLYKKEIDGTTFEELEKNRCTKKKATAKTNYNFLCKLMLDYFHIEDKNNNMAESNNISTKDNNETVNIENVNLKDFVKENTDIDVTDDDIEVYEDVLDELTLNVDNSSKLMDKANRPSFIALIAYSFNEDIDLDSWIVDFFKRNNTYISNQAENYLYMKKDVERYFKKVG